MRKSVLFLALFTVFVSANDCDYYLKMGKAQEGIAAKAYENADLVKTQKHLRFALSNYMSGFKPCMNTPREDELIKSSANVNGILTDKNFYNTVKLQKFFRKK